MSDVKFTCPQCQKVLVTDEQHSGQNATCPGCATPVVVPQTEGVQAEPIVRIDNSNDRNINIQLSSPHLRLMDSKFNSLALIAFILSIFGPAYGITLIPGIICGHISIARCNRDPSLTGRGFAIASLVIGYSLIGLAILAGIVVAIVLLIFAVTGGTTAN